MRRIPVFISSKQEELRDDRLAAAEAIGEFEQFEPVYAENWAPQRSAPESIYTEDALRCPIYVGLFWRLYSVHTEREYNAARSNLQTELMLYLKNCPEGEREEPLRELLKKCQSEHACRVYGDAAELRRITPQHLLVAVTRMVERLHALGNARSVSGPRAAQIRNRRVQLVTSWGLASEPEEVVSVLESAAANLQRLTR